jgi:hypothetical protein
MIIKLITLNEKDNKWKKELSIPRTRVFVLVFSVIDTIRYISF